MAGSGPMPRARCGTCRREVPIVAGAKDAHPSPRLRRHAVIPGGQLECVGSGRSLDVVSLPLVPRRRTTAELARWVGPRTWEEAGL
jgi:hypothetical protein